MNKVLDTIKKRPNFGSGECAASCAMAARLTCARPPVAPGAARDTPVDLENDTPEVIADRCVV